jgi:V8-like Glu-specific endopeptidase
MIWEAQHLGQLEDAITSLDRTTVEALCQRLMSHVAEQEQPFPLGEAKKVLSLLRGKRFFRQLREVAEAFLRSEQTDGAVRRLHAQSLIEENELTSAIGVLEKLIADCADNPGEIAEAQGLIGRALKQEYVNGNQKSTGARARLIRRAVSTYHDVYQRARSKHLWHGINVVACAMRARRDGIAIDSTIDPKAIAEELLGTISQQPAERVSHWDLATAAEACVALDRPSDALEWIRQYLAKPQTDTDAFEVASTLRQLEQVWQLREDSPKFGLLVMVLKAALLQREGGRVAYASGQMNLSLERAGFEKVFGDAGPRTYAWYMTGPQRARAVGRVEDAFGRGIGTGFLVRARDFAPSSAEDAVLFLTNAHVLGRTDADAILPADARVRFEAVAPERTCTIENLLWESPPNQLDATLVKLSALPTKIEPLIPAPPEPLPEFVEGEPRRFYIIGHPLGGQLTFSIDDNLQVGWRRPKLHYRTPTRPGSSGSPVLDDQWRLVALHHAGDKRMQRLDSRPGFYEANEGIWIHDIMQSARGGGLQGAGVEARDASPRKRIFVSYCHSDERFMGELRMVLKPLTRDDGFKLWTDTELSIGGNWKTEIEEAISTADIAILLVTQPFLASDFIYSKELPPILKRSQTNGVKIAWIPISDCLYEKTPLADLQSVWDPKDPVAGYINKSQRQAVWAKIARKIAEL